MLNPNSHILPYTQTVLNRVIDNPNFISLPVTKTNLKRFIKSNIHETNMRKAIFDFIEQQYLNKLVKNGEILSALAKQIKSLAQQQINQNSLYPFSEIKTLSRAGDELAFVGDDDYYYHFNYADMESFNSYDYLTYQELADEFDSMHLPFTGVNDESTN